MIIEAILRESHESPTRPSNCHGGKVQLIAGQRQLRKDDSLCPLLRCEVNQPNVLLDVGLNSTPTRHRLSGGDRWSASHVDKLPRCVG